MTYDLTSQFVTCQYDCQTVTISSTEILRLHELNMYAFFLSFDIRELLQTIYVLISFKEVQLLIID